MVKSRSCFYRFYQELKTERFIQIVRVMIVLILLIKKKSPFQRGFNRDSRLTI